MQREELEDELHSVKYQMQNVENVDSGIKRFFFCYQIPLYVCFLDTMMFQIVKTWLSFTCRHLEEKERGLEEALKHIQILESSISDKDAEVKRYYASFWYILTSVLTLFDLRFQHLTFILLLFNRLHSSRHMSLS